MTAPTFFPTAAPDSQVHRTLRDMDWSASPLGLPEGWPASFCIGLTTILSSPESMYLAWGPERLFFFNDAYMPLLGIKLDGAMGAPMQHLATLGRTD